MKYRAYDTLVPAPKDGTNGTSPIILDLDNENVSIPCTYNGVVAGGLPIISNASLYKGSAKVVSDITWSLGTYSGCVVDTSVISQGQLKVTYVTAMSAYAEIKATYGGNVYTARLTMAKALAGSPGASAKVYSIEPSVSAIVKKVNGTMAPNVVTCEKYVTTGSTARTMTSEKYLFYVIETPSGATTGEYPSGGVPIPSNTTAVIFYLYEDSTRAVLLDKEKIPVISDGANWQGKFLSRVFKRDNSGTVLAPEGGSFNEPWPTTAGWEDGIPDTPTDAKIWYSERWFTSDGASPQESAWSAPKLLLTTTSDEFAFSSVNTPDAPPEEHPFVGNDEWTTTAASGTLWMAQRHMNNGVWTDWSVMRIKGEDGTSVKILGSFVSLYATKAAAQSAFDALTAGNKLTFGMNLITENEEEDSYHWYCKPGHQATSGGALAIVLKFYAADVGDGYMKKSNGHLYVADEDGWNDAGQIRGNDGPQGPEGPEGPQGPQGDNAVYVGTDPSSLTINVSKVSIIFVPVIVTDGGVDVLSDFSLSSLSRDDGTEIPGDTTTSDGLRWVKATDSNNRFGFQFIFSQGATFNGKVHFTVTYKNVEYKRHILVTTTWAGAKPMSFIWENVASGFQFLSGAPGEKEYHIVTYNGKHYLCKVSHTKGSVPPDTDVENNGGHWEMAVEGFGFIATGLILADRAKVDNLCAEYMQMLDDEGNIIFEVLKDGDGSNARVVCNMGEFNDITATNLTVHKGVFDDIILSGFVKPRAVTIDSNNYEKYLSTNGSGDTLERRLNADMLASTVILSSTLNNLISNTIPTPDGKFSQTIIMPSRFSSSDIMGLPEEYIGSTIRIINNTNKGFGFTGAITARVNYKDNTTGNTSNTPINQSWESFLLQAGHEIILKCFQSYNNGNAVGSYKNQRQIGWEILYNNPH